MVEFVIEIVANPAFWIAIGGGIAFNWIRAS